MSAPLIIYGRASSINVRKVLWTCAEMGVAFEREDWGMGYQNPHAPEFLALNPNGQIPVIDDGGFVLWESNSICRYLARKYARYDLLPQDPQACAQVEHWMDWQATDLNNAWRYPFMSVARQHPDYQDPARLAQSLAEWQQRMMILEAQLQRTGAYVVGDIFTLADVVLGLSVHRWYATVAESARKDCPAVAAYYTRLHEREAFGRMCALEARWF